MDYLVWGVLLILVPWSVGSPVMSHIKLDCKESHEIPPESFNSAPSNLADLKASLVTKEGNVMLNISWALNVDNTLKYVKATKFELSQNSIRCDYVPPMSEATVSKTEQLIWFHHVIYVFPADVYHIQALNVPTPPFENGISEKSVTIYAPRKPLPTPAKTRVRTTTPIPTSAPVCDERLKSSTILVSVSGGIIVCLLVLLLCFITYKRCRASFAFGWKKVATSPKVPVLVVYPAENSVFQWAVVALAEYLQQHGGCSVAIDMWQQGDIAKLGPMRWLIEQAMVAERVLIVCPQPSSQAPQKDTAPGASIPAAAQDLYPLVLNFVASQAKNCSELAKFWVVRLGENSTLASELKACRRFYLMKDLNKLCRCLQNQGQYNMKLSDFIFRHGKFISGDSTDKLCAAVQALNGQQASLTKGEKTV